VPVFKR